MLISLYTSRIILNTLGVKDYGINNVVCGLVTMFSFLNAAMASGTQRFLTFQIGKGDYLQAKRIFSMSLNIQVLIVFIILLLSETIGLWFLNTKMVLPPERMHAANWIYQISVFSAILSTTQVPYSASIIAHERFNIYAYVGVVEVLLRLVIVFLLVWISWDKLKLFAILGLFVSSSIAVFYCYYCKKYFEECSYQFKKDNNLLKTLTAYGVWNLWGNLAVVGLDQGINILLNVFYGPVVNAARGIAVNIKLAVNGFVQNLMISMNPQIIKSFASNDLQYMHQLIFQGAKYSYFLLFTLSLPILLETEIILKLWLKIVPEYSIVFTKLIIINLLIDCISGSLMIAAQASGKIKLYQTIIGGLLLLIVPISYFFLKFGFSPEIIFYINIIISFIALFARLIIIGPLVQLSIITYIKNVLFRITLVSLISIIILSIIKHFLPPSFLRFFILGFTSIISVGLVIYLVGLRRSEQLFVNRFIFSLIKKL